MSQLRRIDSGNPHSHNFVPAAWACLSVMWSALRAETTSPIHSDATPPWLVVSLLRAYHITPRPSATLRREAHSAPLSAPRPLFCLTPSLNLLSQPVLRVVVDLYEAPGTSVAY